MLNLLDIYRKDRETRQNRRPGFTIQRAMRIAVVITLSVLFDNISLDFLAAILAVQSILAGFGFNVLVYLTTNRPIPIPSSAKIERKLKINRVNTLGKEIFYNISYFNTVALLCIAVALILALPNAFDAQPFIKLWMSKYHLTNSGKELLCIFGFILTKIGAALLYAILIEATLDFIFIIRRSTYYFEQKIALSDGD